jgi:hypothetical protein
MRQYTIYILTLLTGILILFIPMTALGLYTPEISDHHGVATIRYVADTGFIGGGEFGLTDDLAVIADLGDKDYNRVGLKFLLNPELAFLGGVTNSKLFFGINFAGDFTDKITGIGELDFYSLDGLLATDYELGINLKLTQTLDLRGGLIGTVTETQTSKHFQLGLGYKF